MACVEEGLVYVARDEAANVDLTYEELFERARRNLMTHVRISRDMLSERQRDDLLLRATSAKEVLRDFGAHLRSIEAGKDEYELSRSVSSIDEFLSHAWQTRRGMKTLTLLYYYNFLFANVAYTIASFLGFAVCYCVEESRKRTLAFRIVSPIVMLLLPAIVFGFALCYGMRLRCSPGPSVFLDKLCIHQTSEDLKVMGIKSLETYVRKSKRLILLYDSFTFERLWCTFETAMFAHDRCGDTTDFRFVPVTLAQFVVPLTILFRICAYFGAMVLFFVGPLLSLRQPSEPFFRGITIHGLHSYGFLILLFAPMYGLVGCLLWRRNSDMSKLFKTLANFATEKTSCYNESDRELVYERIRSTWGSLESFDNFVRKDISEAMASTIGRCDAIPYDAVFSLSMPLLALGLCCGLNSPDYDISIYGIGSILNAFLAVTLSSNAWNVLGAVCYSKLSHRPALCIAATTAFCLGSCVLHLYTHNSMWYIAWSLWVTYGCYGYSVAIFSLFTACEMAWLLRFHRMRSQVQQRHPRIWQRWDSAYFAFWVVLALGLLLRFNLMEAITGAIQV